MCDEIFEWVGGFWSGISSDDVIGTQFGQNAMIITIRNYLPANVYRGAAAQLNLV